MLKLSLTGHAQQVEIDILPALKSRDSYGAQGAIALSHFGGFLLHHSGQRLCSTG